MHRDADTDEHDAALREIFAECGCGATLRAQLPRCSCCLYGCDPFWEVVK